MVMSKADCWLVGGGETTKNETAHVLNSEERNSRSSYSPSSRIMMEENRYQGDVGFRFALFVQLNVCIHQRIKNRKKVKTASIWNHGSLKASLVLLHSCFLGGGSHAFISCPQSILPK
jgi:hypothetical protein